MFRELLEDVVNRTEGAVGGLLMGFDGIPVEHYVPDQAGDTRPDVQTVGMEFSVILKEIQRAAEMLKVGGANEVSVRTEALTAVIRILTPEYFAAVTLKPDGNYGKARFLLRTAGSKLQAELG